MLKCSRGVIYVKRAREKPYNSDLDAYLLLQTRRLALAEELRRKHGIPADLSLVMYMLSDRKGMSYQALANATGLDEWLVQLICEILVLNSSPWIEISGKKRRFVRLSARGRTISDYLSKGSSLR